MTQQELFDQFWGYYYGKHYGLDTDPRDAHDAAATEIRNLDLTELRYAERSLNGFDDYRVIIKLRRPGILIGPKGNNIVALQDYLKLANNNENLKVYIEEEPTATLADRIIPWFYDGEDF